MCEPNNLNSCYKTLEYKEAKAKAKRKKKTKKAYRACR